MNQKSRYRGAGIFKSAVIAVVLLMQALLPALQAATSVGFELAQLEIETFVTEEIDLDPPLVDHIPVSSGVAGAMQSFSVKASDTRGIESVTLYYRSRNQDAYSSAVMTRIAGTDNYAVSVQSAAEQRQLEYYFLVVDTGGNKVLNGFPYEPFERFLSQPVATATDGNGQRSDDIKTTVENNAPIPVEQSETSGLERLSNAGSSKTILWGVLGVIVLGALVSGSSGGGQHGASGETVPVTLSVPLPQ